MLKYHKKTVITNHCLPSLLFFVVKFISLAIFKLRYVYLDLTEFSARTVLKESNMAIYFFFCLISQGAGLPKYKFRSTQTTEKV